MRRAARVIAGMGVIVATAAVVLPLTIDLDKVQRRSADRLERVLGRPVVFTQPLRLHLLPIPILTTGPVVVGGPGAPVARVAGVTSRLAVAPLLAGMVEPAELTLEQPSLHLPGGHVQLDSLSLTRASFSPLIVGEARWGVHVATLSASVAGDDGTGAATLSVRLPSAGASLDFSGTITPLTVARSLRGRLTAVAADLSPLGGPAEMPLRIEANLEAGGGEVALSGLVAELGKARATASLSAAHGDPAVVDVTARVTGLDLDSWAAAPAAAGAAVPAAAPPAAEPLPSAPPPAAFPAAGPVLPPLPLPAGLFANLDLVAEDLTWKGQTLSRAVLDATLEQGTLVIRQMRAVRPDGATAVVDGTLTAHDGRPGFDGRVRLTAKALTGSARLGLDGPDLTVEDIRLQAADRSARGRMAARLGLPLAVRIDVDISRLGPLSLSGRILPAGDGAEVQALRLAWRGLDLHGRMHAGFGEGRPRIAAELSADTIDLDRLGGAGRTGLLQPGSHKLPPVSAPVSAAEPAAARSAPRTAAPPPSSGDTPWTRDPIDLSALHAANLKLGVRARSLIGRGLHLDDADGRLSVEDGTAVLETLTGRLWGGDFAASGRLSDRGNPGLSGRVSLSGADAGAVGLGMGDFKITQGRIEADARFATAGRSTWDMAARLAGDGRMAVRDGSISGVDLPAVQRRLNDIQSLGNVAALLQTGLAGGSTRFTALTGTVQARDGIAVTRDLRLDAQGGSAAVESSVDLPRWSTRTSVALRIGESGAPPLVVRLDGPIGNPRKVVDLNAIQRYLVEKGLGRALKKGDDGADKPSGRRFLQELFRGMTGR